MNLRPILILASLACFCGQARSQSLVYCVSYVETQSSYRTRFANVSPFPAQRSDDENLAMLRGTRKTEIYSVSVAEGKRKLLFSDEGMKLEIQSTGAVSPGGKAYIIGEWRDWTKTSPRSVTSERGLYEISLNSSNQFLRIADVQPYQGPALLNAQGTEAVLEGFDNGQFAVSVYAVPQWKLIHRWDLTPVLQSHCPDCTPASYDWLADGKSLFFELVLVGEYDDEELKSSAPGTYLVTDGGKDLGSIPLHLGAFQLDGYVHPKFVERQVLGQLPDGSYLFQDYAVRKGRPLTQTEPFLVIGGSDPSATRIIPQKFAIRQGFLSRSGCYVAYIEDRQTPNYQSEKHLWVKDLRSGEERELFTAPPPKPPTSPEPNITLSLLGWINE